MGNQLRGKAMDQSKNCKRTGRTYFTARDLKHMLKVSMEKARAFYDARMDDWE